MITKTGAHNQNIKNEEIQKNGMCRTSQSPDTIGFRTSSNQVFRPKVSSRD